MVHHTKKRFHVFTKLSFTSHGRFCFRCTLMSAGTLLCARTRHGAGRPAEQSLLHVGVSVELDHASQREENTLLRSVCPIRSCLKKPQHWTRTLETKKKKSMTWMRTAVPFPRHPLPGGPSSGTTGLQWALPRLPPSNRSLFFSVIKQVVFQGVRQREAQNLLA